MSKPETQLSSHAKRLLRERLFGGREAAPCCFCRRRLSRKTATLEHVVPRSEGGGWDLDNLRLSCEGCNNERGVEDFAAYRAKVRARMGKP